MNSFIVETQRLDFKFRSGYPILQQLNLQVPKGSIYGFLGPNGAGKTTTLRLLLGLLRKQEGTISLFGQHMAPHRISVLQRLGSLIEQPSLYGHLSGRENLEIFRLAYQCERKRIDRVLEMVKLTNAAGKKVRAYSLGMKQRLSIAIALLHDPELLILDEPTNGLDPSGIIETRELIKELNREQGKTILVSSHLLTEVEKMATHVGIIHKGKLLFQGTLPELEQLQSQQSAIEIEVDNVEKAVRVLDGQFPLKGRNGHYLVIDFESKQRTAALNKILVQEQVEVYRLHVSRHDLENLFIQITTDN